jgi:superfamily II DNA helicase RecQ
MIKVYKFACWTNEEHPCRLLIVTKVMGAGVHHLKVRFVIHYSLVDTRLNYIQEIGRGGRDGHPCLCIMMSTTESRLKHRARVAYTQATIKVDQDREAMDECIHQSKDVDRIYFYQNNIDTCKHILLEAAIGIESTTKCNTSCISCILANRLANNKRPANYDDLFALMTPLPLNITGIKSAIERSVVDSLTETSILHITNELKTCKVMMDDRSVSVANVLEPLVHSLCAVRILKDTPVFSITPKTNKIQNTVSRWIYSVGPNYSLHEKWNSLKLNKKITVKDFDNGF